MFLSGLDGYDIHQDFYNNIDDDDLTDNNNSDNRNHGKVLYGSKSPDMNKDNFISNNS